MVDIEDFKLVLCELYYVLDDEWTGDGGAWEDETIKVMMEKYRLSKEDILSKNAVY